MIALLLVLSLANYIVAYEGEPLGYYQLENAQEYFSWFVKNFNKKYSDPAEERKRFDIFKGRLIEINKKNNKQGNTVFGITRFSDLTSEEFLNQYTSMKLSKTVCEIKTLTNTTSGKYPEEFDWRSKNVVTEVKDQQTCSSSWAFAATGNIEGQYALKTKNLVELSPQQILDCDERSVGCTGGRPDYAFLMLIEKGGQLKESDYPYKNTDENPCNPNMSKAVAKLSKCINYDAMDEEKLKQILVDIGPLIIRVDIKSFQDYYGGIIEDCHFSRLDYSVLLVGYGIENGIPYWSIKISWGTGYGEEGYVRVKRGVNACGLMSYYATTAVLVEN